MEPTASIPERVNHQDAARAAVPQTAVFVATLRAFESDKEPNDRLFFDPWAKVLVGGEKWLKTSADKMLWGGSSKRDFWIDFLAARTRWIDDSISARVVAAPELQVVVLGAGLDTRAYRLESLRSKPVFEVDFAEVLEAKQTILSGGTTPAEPLAKRAAVAADFSDGSWRDSLVAAGFNTLRPSLWLLEGLSGYLTGMELDQLFEGISELSTDGSRTIQTYLGEGMRHTQDVTNMHHFYVRNKAHLSEFMENHGWMVHGVHNIGTVADSYGRSGNIPDGYEYYLLDAAWEPALPQSQ
mmetsp:Transcript_90077/g.209561  ORF Transcript_90077/g.209561 Transcript_90077/m.209561 type:complete len:297 (+) Transcript_90077:54-944(+)|eukprot:CAMPEP_0171072914 /NCGR_PEP_ID=MMETSP0766_2-20121228/11172_1 /TAXON_ID=439317 /ORGANISM="Gambierdiscus australes, Strain CAWD 149" /LENGTH=296 /DNA_ID=CAMNT_0011529557 /DNA_START=35 /DNA_END=925 /DNA_ORIENTATION=-